MSSTKPSLQRGNVILVALSVRQVVLRLSCRVPEALAAAGQSRPGGTARASGGAEIIMSSTKPSLQRGNVILAALRVGQVMMRL
jgi:hypothetical protein